jgi:FkbM family methyltransferase
MNKEKLLRHFTQLEKRATSSKLYRLFTRPVKYLFAVSFQKFFSRLLRKDMLVKTRLFTGAPFYIKLPAGTDIYITGGKSDDSELRLAQFIIKTLEQTDCFVDVGAHFGYYTMLAAACAEQGKVYAFEGSPQNFNLLSLNTAGTANIKIYNKLVSTHTGKAHIYEFPTNYSEYNSPYLEQYTSQPWYREEEVKKTSIDAISLDDFIKETQITPRVIKIDAEGSEFDILKGGAQFLQQTLDCYIAIEYLAEHRFNEHHQKAVNLLYQFAYHAFTINQQGDILPCEDINHHMRTKGLESDNIIFCK